MTLRQRLDYLRHLSVAFTRQHHLELAPALAAHVPEGGVVIDVGAHAGQFSKLFSRMVGPKGAVHAFEPSGYTRAILTQALRFNRCRNVVVHADGLSDAPGELVLRTPIKRTGARGYGRASLGGASSTAARGEITETVRLMRLDDFAAARRLEVDFIKADIEGWEGYLLRGARQVLESRRPALFLELDHEMLARAGDDAQALFDGLIGLGYRATKAPDWRAAPHYDGKGDYLFSAA